VGGEEGWEGRQVNGEAMALLIIHFNSLTTYYSLQIILTYPVN